MSFVSKALDSGPRYRFTFNVTKLADDGAGPRYHTVLSDETVDSYGDIIRSSGWDLERFNSHPVLLAGHNYADTNSHIGKWEDVKVVKTRKSLEGVARYFSGEGNPKADWAEHIASRGEAAFSVGFQPIEMQTLGDDGDSWFGPFEFTEQSLLEGSHVNVPANPSAVQDAVRRTFGERDWKTVMGLLDATTGDAPPKLERLTMTGDYPTNIGDTVTTTGGFTGFNYTLGTDSSIYLPDTQPVNEERIAQRVVELLREQGEPSEDVDDHDSLAAALAQAVLGQLRKES